MKIYIAGKITGLPRKEAAQKFLDAELRIIEKGHKAVNPMVMSGFGLEHRRYMSIARNILLDKNTDAIYMLDNWQDSEGATEEHKIARCINLPIYYEDPSTKPKAEGRGTDDSSTLRI